MPENICHPDLTKFSPTFPAECEMRKECQYSVTRTAGYEAGPGQGYARPRPGASCSLDSMLPRLVTPFCVSGHPVIQQCEVST